NISSGFNEDVIAEDAPASDHTTISVDDPGASGAGYAFMSELYPGAITGLPANGIINSEATPNLQFHLADYSGNNALRLVNDNDSGALVLASPQAADTLFIAATSGSGESGFTGTIYFSDNSTQAISSQTVPDWYSG